MTSHPKLKLKIAPTCADCEALTEIIRLKYDIVYCGIHKVDEELFVYLHNRERMSSKVLIKILKDMLDIDGISKYSFLEGEVIDSVGEVLKHGGSRVHPKKKRKYSAQNITNNNITNNDNSTTTNNNVT